ncbi:MAG: OmpH family outer membrane protein [Deltaproteobacteria bacterium]|nr:OmpH family outer membrane protein [Deltaproteobacteria bacterium]
MKRFMMVSIVIFIGFLLTLPVMAAKEGPTKIGVIDIQKIMRESKAARNARTLFQKDVEAKRDTLKAKEKEIRILEEEIKSADPKMSPEARREKEFKLSREVKELQRLGADIEEELKKKDVELTRKLLGEIMQIVQSFAKKEHYTLILERASIVTADNAIDITDKIIKLYDAQKK